MERIKAYFETVNLNDYDLGGVEITEEDFEEMLAELEKGGKDVKTVVDDYLYGVRAVLDAGLPDEEE